MRIVFWNEPKFPMSTFKRPVYQIPYSVISLQMWCLMDFEASIVHVSLVAKEEMPTIYYIYR